MLERLRDRLDGCIGCGCLSLGFCKLANPDDEAASRGPGPRFILEDELDRVGSLHAVPLTVWSPTVLDVTAAAGATGAGWS